MRQLRRSIRRSTSRRLRGLLAPTMGVGPTSVKATVKAPSLTPPWPQTPRRRSGSVAARRAGVMKFPHPLWGGKTRSTWHSRSSGAAGGAADDGRSGRTTAEQSR